MVSLSDYVGSDLDSRPSNWDQGDKVKQFNA